MDLLKNNNLYFSETKSSNDVFFSRISLACADRITVVHDDLITKERFINPGSISSNRGKNSQNALNEYNKIYRWMKDHDMLKFFLSDYLIMFDNTANYEMKNAVNPLFAKEMSHLLNCEEPWKDMKSEHIMRVLKRSLGSEGAEILKAAAKKTDSEKTAIEKGNETKRARNKNLRHMQEMIKKESLESYGRDLSIPESRSPVYLTEKESRSDLYIDSEHKSKKISGSHDSGITVVIPMRDCADRADVVLRMFSTQSFADFEVICVIYDSSDDTEKNVSVFCDTDPRFRCTARETWGTGDARNAGLELSKGKYIIFADVLCDYYQDFLVKLYETALEYHAQVVLCQFIANYSLQNTEDIRGFDDNNYYENIVYSHYGIDSLFASFDSCVTNKLYSIAFLEETGLRFSDQLPSQEAFFSYTTMSMADRILVVNDALLNMELLRDPDHFSSEEEGFPYLAIADLRILYKWLKKKSLLEFHIVDFMKLVNSILCIEGSHRVAPVFISDFASMLNEEEPYNSMTAEEILYYLDEGLLAENAALIKTNLSHISDQLFKADKQLLYLKKTNINRVHTAHLIQQVLKDRYGWEFNIPVDEQDRPAAPKKK